ncbi:MAG: CBASS cGAMP-activated phospholipase [Phycisphaeraceae bacterium]
MSTITSPIAPSPRDPFRILSLDGGGIRGLVTAVWLARLESKLGSPLADHFDLVAGTSTGGILAAAVGLKIPAADMIDLYRKRARDIFPSAWARRWNRVGRTFTQGLSAPKYSEAGLRQVLLDVVGDRSFAQLAITPTLITSYNTLTRTALVFKNHKPEHQSLLLRDILAATAAAPTYFPAHVMQVEHADVCLIDGGVVANNPTACAIAEAVRWNDARHPSLALKDFIVASFGTGHATRPITIAQAREWGALEWAIPAIDVLMDGAGDATEYIARQLIADENHFRFQTRLDKAFDAIDNADEANLNALVNLANHHLEAEGGEQNLARLANRLQPRPAYSGLGASASF